jgi:CHAT domain-containing protein
VLLLGEEATLPRLRAVLPTRARWRSVHFACHAILDLDRPLLSALALTPDGADGGFLTALEIVRLSVSADLVVLAADDTGRGRLVRGEGVLGLVRAFLSAGAPRVVASLGDLDDEATRVLMTRFYERWKAGSPTATALREAQESLRSEERWRHPRFWAPWVLWGLGD